MNEWMSDAAWRVRLDALVQLMEMMRRDLKALQGRVETEHVAVEVVIGLNHFDKVRSLEAAVDRLRDRLDVLEDAAPREDPDTGL